MFGLRSGRFGGQGHHGRGGRHGGEDQSPWGERSPEFGRGGGRGGRMGRLLAHGDLHLIALHLVAERPRHGYEVIKSIEAMVNGAYSPSPGTIYPALTLLEEQGHVRIEASEGNKKLYAVTEQGLAYLAANKPVVETMLARMAQAGDAREAEEPAPSILRAIENLKLALRLRLSRGPLTEEQVRIVTAALDRAVSDIEQA